MTDDDQATGIRASYLGAVREALLLLTSDEVVERWDDRSALEGMTVGGLAVHLFSGGVAMVDRYLAAEPPAGSRALPAHRLIAGVPTDQSADLHVGVRSGSAEQAMQGPGAASAWARDLVLSVEHALRVAPADRRLTVMAGIDMALDEFLVTRLVEIAVHVDDLAVSVGAEPPPLTGGAAELVLSCLVGVARHRHGDLAVLRALTRRERATPGVLQVF